MSFQNTVLPDGSININVIPSFGRIVNANETDKQRLEDVNKLMLELKPTITVQQPLNKRQRRRQDTHYIEYIKNLLKLQINKRLAIRRDIFIERQITPIIHASNVQFRNDINRQVQQLHEEEMELLRAEHSEEISAFKEQIKKLQGEVDKMKEELKVMQKNGKHHACQLISDNNQSFLIQNIDMINCANVENDIDGNNKEQQLSKLDESELCQFNQLIVQGKTGTMYLGQVGNNNNNNFALLIPKSQRSINLSSQQSSIIHQNLLKNQSQVVDVKNHEPYYAHNNNKNNNNNDAMITILHQTINQLNIRIAQLQSQVQSLFETNQQLKKQCTKHQLSQKSIKNNYQSLYKQSKFMADHIRTLANDKFKLQRKVKQLQKQLRDANMKGLKKSMTLLGGEEGNSKKISVNSSCVSSSVRFNKGENNSKISNDDVDKISNGRSSQKNDNDVKKYSMLFVSSEGFDNVRTSQENSVDSKQFQNIHRQQHQHRQQLQHVPIMKVISIENFNQQTNKQINIPVNTLTQSQFLQVNNRQFDTRKAMPSYKKVSHISPSFKKPSLKNTKEKSPQFLKLIPSSSQQLKQDIFDKSDFMDEIRKQIEKKSAIKKITINDNHQGHRPSSLFNDLTKKRSNTKN